MRLHAKAPDGLNASVTVNGRLARMVVEAHEEGGWVQELKRDPRGRFRLKRDGNAPKLRFRAGIVKITIEGAMP